LDQNNYIVEAIEVKHGQEITLQIVYRAKEKILKNNHGRYYIFASNYIKESEVDKINALIKGILSERVTRKPYACRKSVAVVTLRCYLSYLL
jgi:DNA (cytosine-5)-methyltransferase 1